MQNKLILIMILVAMALTAYVPDRVLYRENIWRYDKAPVPTIEPWQAERQLAQLKSQIDSAAAAGNYPPAEAYRVDEALEKISLGVDYPEVSEEHGFPSYRDEWENGPPLMWDIWSAQNHSTQVRLALAGSPAQVAEYQRILDAAPHSRELWHPQLVKRPKTRYLSALIAARLAIAVPLLLLLALRRLGSLGWVFTRLFTRQTLQFAGYALALVLSVFTGPAVAQQLQVKADKKKQQTVEEPIQSSEAPTSAAPPPPPPKTQVQLEFFGDLHYERQQWLTIVQPLGAKLSLMFYNQNRQAASGGPKFSVAAAGLRFKPRPAFSFTAMAGPQLNLDTGHVDHTTTYVIASYQGRRAELTAANRLSWGLQPGVPLFVDRHPIWGRVHPMPSWLFVQGEVRRSPIGVDENFWGPMVRVGRLLPQGLRKRGLGGLYVWPYHDFVKNTWDVRSGIQFSFAH